jgi:hypothetical protein
MAKWDIEPCHDSVAFYTPLHTTLNQLTAARFLKFGYNTRSRSHELSGTSWKTLSQVSINFLWLILWCCQYLDYMASNDRDRWTGMEAVVNQSRRYLGICGRDREKLGKPLSMTRSRFESSTSRINVPRALQLYHLLDAVIYDYGLRRRVVW